MTTPPKTAISEVGESSFVLHCHLSLIIKCTGPKETARAGE
jgi:hypothetical protein